MKQLLTPAIWVAAAAIVLQAGLVTPSAAGISFALYGAVIAGLLMAWRFHSSRIFFALLVLFLGQHAIEYFSGGRIAAGGAGSTALAAVGLLLPLNFVLASLSQEKGFTFPSVAPAGLLLFVESVVVAVLCRPEAAAEVHRGARHVAGAGAVALPYATLIAFAVAAVVMVVRFVVYRKPAETGLLWALAAALLALRFGGAGRIAAGYFAAAAVTLAVSVVETSYMLAYHDELTTLPSRRAFQEGLLRLAAPYSIAMVDIDHFKRCNDTYGHDTGDEVLRMVAARLARVTGGGEAYRCGGEEFAVVFAGKTTGEVLEHLEELRAKIEASSFRLRGRDRRQELRGPDRRNQKTRGRASTGNNIRQLARKAEATEISVTASMGVASASEQNAAPEEVIKAADKALYRAKAGGRNRIEAASTGSRRGVRRKAAGIA